MKKLATILVATALVAMTASAALAANAVRISQVYGGGGGSTTATDFVELFNSSGVAVDVSGWVVEYGSATGAWNSFAGNAFTFPANTYIQPCAYLLLNCNIGTGAGVVIPTADFTVSPTTVFNMSGTNGKAMLVTALNTNVVCGSETGTIVDKVSWGSANCSEGTAMSVLTSSTAGFRAGGGFTDSDNNSADFTTGVPAPRYSGSPRNPTCLAVPATRNTWGQLKSIYR